MPKTAFVKTFSNDAQTTDSAPYMTGFKMNNEVISMSPDTKAFDSSFKPYISGSDITCPTSGNGTPEPSLADMTIKAIDVLSKNNKGYFLMVEGGRIDHALHDTNDTNP